MSVTAEDADERQLLVSQVGGQTVLTMQEPSSPASSGFVSGSIDLEDLEAELEAPEVLRQRRRFHEMLRRSREEDLTSVEATNCIYHAGYDKHGRAVIVFIGKWFKHSQLDLEKAFLYLLRVVDPVANHDYVVIYFHTRTCNDNIPNYWWIKEIYNTLTYKFKKNLKAFYVVHPTMWTKVTCWWFSTFMAPAIKNKIHNVNALEELSKVVELKNLAVPMFITEQDMVFNGLRYYQP